MEYSIDTLLALPQKERRQIAEQLWKSLSPRSSVSVEDEETITLLQKRWEKIQSGESKSYTPTEMREIVSAHRNKE